jgi:hypothetical protein
MVVEKMRNGVRNPIAREEARETDGGGKMVHMRNPMPRVATT